LITILIMVLSKISFFSLTLLAISCGVIELTAQSLNPTAEQIRSTFPDESALFLERSTTLNLVIEGDSLKGYSDVYEDVIHLRNQTEIYSNRKVYGSHFNRVENIKAKTLVWDKSRYKEILVNSFKKNSAPGENIFYDDSYFYTFNYPAVASGNRTQLEYREVQDDIRFISGYIFSSFLRQLKSTYRIKTPADVDIHFEVLNDAAGKIRYRKTEKGNVVTHEWSAENVEPYKVEDGSPSIRYYEPHVVCYVKSFKVKSAVHHVLPDLRGLHAWYYSLIKDVVDEAPSEEVVKVIEGIKKNYSSEEDIVKEIFYWVQRNIQYIAFEDGMRGFIPHKASYTCEKKYGDCKDMANLIVGMLRVAGIKAYPTWIGSRDIPYRYSQIPTPLVDNHMIATYISGDGKYYFLDATGKYTEFGYPTAMIQGKEALITLGPDAFEVREVKPVDKKLNLISDSLVLNLKDNVLVGRGVNLMHGLAKADAGSYFDRIEEKEVRDFVLRVVGKGSNKFILDQYKVHDADRYDKPTRIDYDFRIGDYCQEVGNELYINLNLNKDNYNRIINDQTRKTPHEFNFKYDKVESIEFEIPDGYEIEYLPPDESFTGKLTGCKVSYTVRDNKIHYHKYFYVDYLLMTTDEFKLWNEEVAKISNT
jgi:transglutaminase-like putative cysteine protease